MSAPVTASVPDAPESATAAKTATAPAPAAASAAASSTARPTAIAQSTTRVTILVGTRMVDMVLPAAVPVETYIDDAVAVLAEIVQDEPAQALAGTDLAAQGRWTLARPGSPPLRPELSLDESRVVDGSLLTLVAVSRTERYRPLVEDVIDAIAILEESPQFRRTDLKRFVGWAIPLLTIAVSAVAVIAWMQTGHPRWWPVGLGIGGMLALGGSWVIGRSRGDADLSESLMVAAYPLLTVGAALAVPVPRDAGSIGAPQYAAAAAAVLFVTAVSRGGPHRRVELAAFTAVSAFALASSALLCGYGWSRWVPGFAVLLGFFIVTNAAKLTVAAARIALPPVPAPGEIVRHEELLDAVSGTDTSPENTQTLQAIFDSVPDSVKRLSDRSMLSTRLLIGIVAAGAVVFATGAVTAVVQGHYFVPSLVLAGLVTAVCGFRSRLFAERGCVWALLAAAVAIPTGVAIRLSLWYPDRAWIFVTIFIAVALLAVAIVGALIQVHRISPVVKRALEMLDGTAVASIVPMVLWITGVFYTVREIQF